MTSLKVRQRVDGDLPNCTDLAEIVRVNDGYPAFLFGQLRSFVATPGALNAWVAEIDHTIVGHVALHPSSTAQVMTAACDYTGLQAHQLGVVARLFVAPAARGHHAGRALLATAAAHAVTFGLCPVLDVDIALAAAIRLYEASGWRRAGEVDVPLPNGDTLREAVYIWQQSD